MKSRSKKAFSKNVETEMRAGKSQPQSLAIAYSVKRKKKASGGTVESGSRDMNMAEGGPTGPTNYRNRNKSSDMSGGQRKGPQGYPKYQEQAQNEKGVHTPVSGVTGFPGGKGTSAAGDYTKDRYAGKPTFEAGPDHPAKKEHKRVIEESRKIKPKLKGLAEGGRVSADSQDMEEVSRNRGNKPPKQDSWTDNSTVTQAQKNNGRTVLPIKRPKMVPSNAFSTRLYDEEGHLQESASPGPYDAQPPEHDNEEGANRQGHALRDNEDEHSTDAKPYHEDIEHDDTMDESEPEMRRAKYADGGEIHKNRDKKRLPDMEPSDSGIQEEERHEESDLEMYADPSEDEGSMDAHSRNEEGPDRQGDEVPDMEDEHSTHRKPYAGGGEIGDSEENIDHDMEMNPAHDEHSPDDSEDQYDEEAEIEHAASIAAAIMQQRKKMYASGGTVESGSEDMNMANGGDVIGKSDSMFDVMKQKRRNGEDSIYAHPEEDQADLNRNAQEDANMEDDSSFNALRKENYSEKSALAESTNPSDSAQTGDEEEKSSENKHDNRLVSAIRRKMKTKSPITR
jgi:hypothetical protein